MCLSSSKVLYEAMIAFCFRYIMYIIKDTINCQVTDFMSLLRFISLSKDIRLLQTGLEGKSSAHDS